MRFLLIGATGFIGPPVARELIRAGHEVTLFHRGHSEPEEFSEIEWTRTVAEAAGWNGSVVSLTAERVPAHLKLPFTWTSIGL